MLAKNLRDKNMDELLKLINDLKAKLFTLRFKNATGQLNQPHQISLVKKDIARVLTIINEKKEESNYGKRN